MPESIFADVVDARLSRRRTLRGLLALPFSTTIFGGWPIGRAAAGADTPSFDFEGVAHGIDGTHHVAAGYDADILIRWGDAIRPGVPAFDPRRQTAAAQRRRFGYNNDFLGFVPLPGDAGRGLLCVNHEYVNHELMFPVAERGRATRARVDVEMAAHSGSIVEVARGDGGWRVVIDGRYNRRITALDTEMRLSGPVAGHPRLRTGTDPSGGRVIGTIANCAGGITPWGTYLMAEENFHFYFAGDADGKKESPNYRRYGVGKRTFYDWGTYYPRWNIDREPNAPNRFGWIVEVDPLDPSAPPVKRTALGRFKHEGAESILNGDGRLVLYSGDDERFEYLYRFVSRDRVDLDNRAANRDLLDDGTLSVARFSPDGKYHWLPLIFGTGGLTPEAGFESQADVLIEARRAADILGATRMDRPEDVTPNPRTGKVYVMLTNNSKRRADDRDAVNDRARNIWGQIVEMAPAGGDHSAPGGRWELLVKGGDPARKAETGAKWHAATGPDGWFACPDNAAVDPSGRLWVATDQGRNWARASGTADGLWAIETEGAARGLARMLFRVPVGAEMCGPCFTPDGETLFLSVQHPGADGTKDFAPFARKSTYEDPATRWPDFDSGLPPRPAVVAITRKGGGRIGS